MFPTSVFLAHCGEKAESSADTQHVDGDVRTTRYVAHELAQFFFATVRAWQAGLNDDPGHLAAV